MVDLIVGEKQKKETKRAIAACNDYLRMGVGRSLRKLHEIYVEREQNTDKEGIEKPPSTRFNTIAGWSSSFGWVERAEVYDARMEKEKTKEAQEIMQSGLALEHERVKVLKELADKIVDHFDSHDLYRNSPMKIGRGDKAEIVDVEVYNTTMLNDLRSLLDDIAKETGGRTNKPEPKDSAYQENEKFYLPADAIAPSFYGVYRDIRKHGHTEYWFKGGRGSTKSSFTSEVIIELIINNPEWHALATRQVANTLRDSVYSQFLWAINYMGLADKFRCTTNPLEITYIPTGQKIYFRGGDDPLKIKSIKPRFGYINVLWFEEVDQFKGAEKVRSILQSVIRGGDAAYIFKTNNPPRSRNNWANKEIEIPKDNRLVHHSDYRDVPVEWLGRTFIEEAEFLKEINPGAYEHEYLGIATGVGGLVFDNVVIREIKDEDIYGKKDEYDLVVGGFDTILHGLDWGYFPDPAHYGQCHYDPTNLTLYIFGEVRKWKHGNRELYDALVEYGYEPKETIICDSAEPKSIADFREYGASARGAEKGPDSVRYSMKWLQSLKEIVIDNKRCPYTAEEFLNYEHEVDKDGNYISDYPDKDNHAIDEVRYATNLIWRRRGQ